MTTSMLPDREAVQGGAVVMHGQLMALAARHRVTLATLVYDDPTQRAACERLRTAGIDVHCVWRPPPVGAALWARRLRFARQWVLREEPLRTLAFTVPAMQKLLDRLFLAHRFDVLQAEDNAMGNYRYPTALPTVLTEHEVRTDADVGAAGPDPSWAARVAGRIEQRRWQQYQRRVWEQFDRVQVFTVEDAQRVRRTLASEADRVRVNPFGVDLPSAPNPDRERPGHVVFVGGFMHPPNVDAARWLGDEIMPRLRKRAPGSHLTIVGSDPPRAVRDLAGDDLTVTGRVPAIEPFLEEAAVVLAPVRTGGGMRVKVLQAMAAGKAVVTTTLGAAGLTAPADGKALPLVVADEAADIAQATADLLERAEYRRTLGQRARGYVGEHYSWSAYGRRLEAIYADLVPSDAARTPHVS